MLVAEIDAGAVDAIWVSLGKFRGNLLEIAEIPNLKHVCLLI